MTNKTMKPIEQTAFECGANYIKDVMIPSSDDLLITKAQLQAFFAARCAELSEPLMVKPLTWNEDRNNWYDDKCGFHIYYEPTNDIGEQYVAAWGEGDPESLASLDEAKEWCKKELADWVNDVCITTAPPPTTEVKQYVERLESLIYRIRNHDSKCEQFEWVEQALSTKPLELKG